MLFFSKEISEINKRFPNLLRLADTDGNEESTKGKEDGTEESQENDSSENFRDKWNWQYMIDIVSSTMNIDWHTCYSLNVIEFLNMVCYYNDKSAFDKEQMKKWKTQN